MSRCFPFPPPGYERKHKPEDLDILKEAKLKERKHKKEKKDKERKKDKKKKEKDGSDEKQKDKKDRKGKHKDKKEKHKDKKKDREDQSKDKDKSSISEESSVSGKHKGKCREKLLHAEGKTFAPFQGQNGYKPSRNSLLCRGPEESKFVQELDRRIRDDNGRGSRLPERVSVVDKRDQETATRAEVGNSGVLAEEKANNKDNNFDYRKINLQGLKNVPGGNTILQDFTPMAKTKVSGNPRPVDEQNERRLEGKEKFKEKNDSKQKDRDKKSNWKEKDKEKKKEEKVKVKAEIKFNDLEKSKEVRRNDLVTSIKSTDLSRDFISSAINEGNLRKRKDTDTNGFLHEFESRPNKSPRPSHKSTENGMKLENTMSYLMYCIIEGQKTSPSKPRPKPQPQPESSKKPPHPDSKYLSEVLKVPNMGDWSENDDQEWLFSKKGLLNKLMIEELVRAEVEPPRVWSEGVYIESADVLALPYVIPY